MILQKNYTTNELLIANTTLRIHPMHMQILEKSKKIAKQLGIYSDAFYQGHHHMTSYLFVDTDIDISVMCTVWFSTLYYLDDFFGEDVQENKETIKISTLLMAWENPSKIDTELLYGNCKVLCRAVAFCSNYIRKNSNPVFFKKYTFYLKEHIKHSLNPLAYRSVKEYISSRIHFGGMYPTIGMIEFSNQSYLRAETMNKIPEIQKAVDICALIGALSNDLISYHKEKHSEQNLINAYLKTNEAICLDEAIQKGITLINNYYQSFEKLQAHIFLMLKEVDVLEQKIAFNFISGLEKLIAASYHWQVNTNRYRSEENIFEDLKESILAV